MQCRTDNKIPALQPIVDELCSSWGGPVGDYKEVEHVTLKGMIATDPAAGEATASVLVHSTGAHDGRSAKMEVAFDLSLRYLEELAREAPRCRDDFNRICQAVATRLEAECAEYMKFCDWRDKGMPTQEPTPVRKPISFKRA